MAEVKAKAKRTVQERLALITARAFERQVAIGKTSAERERIAHFVAGLPMSRPLPAWMLSVLSEYDNTKVRDSISNLPVADK